MDNNGIGNKTRKGLAWDLMGSMTRQVASFVVSITLARLLAPEQFGIIGMAMAFISIAQVFVDVGFTDGLIQKKEVSDEAYSTVFFLNIALSLLMAGLIYAAAGWIGHFYDNPLVAEVVRYLAIVPPIAALGRVHAAILIKRMDFKSLTIRDIIATILGGTVGIWAAFHEFGVYSLVFQQVVTVVVGVILLWRGSMWRPQLVFNHLEVKSLLSFSSYMFFDHFTQQVFNKIDTLFIGKIFSLNTLGLYSRAESLNSQIKDYTTNTIRRVSFPLFSAVQDDDEKFRLIYFKAFNVASFISVLIAGGLYFLSSDIIITLLGEKWVETIPIFKVLVFSTILSPHIALMSKAILGKGLSKLKFYLGILQRFIYLIPVLIGLVYGFMGLVYGVVFSRFVMFVLFTLILKKRLNISSVSQLLHFFIVALPLFVCVGYDYFFNLLFSDFTMCLLFVLFEIIMLKALGHESLNIAIRELSNLQLRLLRTKIKINKEEA